MKIIALSSDTFYGIISSGLTKKTHLSFISSNSSFTECVRTKNKRSANVFHTHILSSLQINSQCSDTYWNNCSTMSRQPIQSDSSYIFKKCEFISLSDNSGQGGGAIFFNNGKGKLKIEESCFSSCESTAHGGAVYAASSSSCKLISSSLHFCRTTRYTIGGGAFIDSSQDIQISDSAFIQCECGDSGGGVDIRTSKTKANNWFAVQSTLFVGCKGLNTESDGGGTELYINNATLGCYSCVFSQCVTGDGGGGLYLQFNQTGGQAEFPLSFCFFHANRGGKGNDVFLRDPSASNSPFLRCFSTTTNTPRIGGVSGKDNDWLPLGTVTHM